MSKYQGIFCFIAFAVGMVVGGGAMKMRAEKTALRQETKAAKAKARDMKREVVTHDGKGCVVKRTHWWKVTGAEVSACIKKILEERGPVPKGKLDPINLGCLSSWGFDLPDNMCSVTMDEEIPCAKSEFEKGEVR